MDHPPQPTLLQVDPLHPLTSLQWTECARMPVSMWDVQAVVLGNEVYVGGYTSESKFCLYVSDLLMMHTWKTIKSPTLLSAIASYQKKLVLVGGLDPSTRTSTNQLWVMEDNETWTQSLPSMPTPRLGASAATIQNNLIVAGGLDSRGEILDVVEVYNGRQWETALALPRACYDMKSAIHKGTWYLIGGWSQDKEVFCASLESVIASTQSEMIERVWTTLPEVRHEWSSTAVWGGRLMAIGGLGGPSSDILSYSPRAQLWVKVGDLPVGLSTTCTIVLPIGELLVVGGVGTGGGSQGVFKGSLRADLFQPATNFDISVLERLETRTGINIFKEIVPKCLELIGHIWLQPELVHQSWLILNPAECCKRVLEQWLVSSDNLELLHLPATWEMLFSVLRSLELGELAQQVENWLRIVPAGAVSGPDYSVIEEVGGVEGKEQEGGSEEHITPGAVVKWGSWTEKEPVKMKQEHDLAKTVSMLEEKVVKREEQLLQCEEAIQMYKERHQKLLQQMESVMTENEQLRKQITAVEEGALRPAGESITASHLRGVDVIGETKFSVTNEAQTFHWAGYGLKLHIPQASLPAGEGHCSIEIKASLAGQFTFPENTTLVSAVYWLCSEVKFVTPLTVEIQHCGKHSGTLRFVRAKCSQRDLPYQFKPLSSRGVFSFHHCYGSVTVSSFSGLGVTQEDSEEQLYCARLYYLGNRIDWRVHFVITKDLEASITAVHQTYRKIGAIEGPDQIIEFEEDKITLELSERDLSDLGGWTILALIPPRIFKREVDSYESGRRIPSCQLQVAWTKDEAPVVIRRRVTLHGAKDPPNYITVQSDPLPLAAAHSEGPGVSRRRQEHTSEDEGTPKRLKLFRDDEDLALKNTARMESEPESMDGAPHCPAELRAEPELPDLMNLVAARIPSKWRLVGIQLHLKDSELDGIEVASNDSLHCFSSVFTLWKRKEIKLPLSWWTVLQALEAASVDEQRLARQVRSKLTTPSHD